MHLTDLRSGRDLRCAPALRASNAPYGPVNGLAVLYNRFFQEIITEICIERLLNIPLISRYQCLHGIDIFYWIIYTGEDLLPSGKRPLCGQL
jgi:hypothetical protein